jgi:L-rhamnose mutarotase
MSPLPEISDSMKTYCFALDLHDDPNLIAEYRQSGNIWPEVVDRIKGDGVVSEEIYLAGNRLFMILHTTDEFSLEDKQAADKLNPEMQKWEELMGKYQKPLPQAQPGGKWMLMEKIFEVN